MIIAFSFVSQFQVRLSAGSGNTSVVDLVVEIRDRFDCVTEVNISSVVVRADVSSVSQLIDTFENSFESLSSNPMVQLLSSGNQNVVAQLVTSLCEQFNQRSNEALGEVVSSKSFFIM